MTKIGVRGNKLRMDLRWPACTMQELLFEERNASSVAWNSEFDDMFCYSGNGMLSIKTADFPLHQQKLQGFVVGFKGSKIFCLHYVNMQTIDVPQSSSMHRLAYAQHNAPVQQTARPPAACFPA